MTTQLDPLLALRLVVLRIRGDAADARAIRNAHADQEHTDLAAYWRGRAAALTSLQRYTESAYQRARHGLDPEQHT